MIVYIIKNMDNDESDIIKDENLKISEKSVKFNLLLAIIIIFFYILLQIIRGKIDFDNLLGDKYLPADYRPKPYLENVYEKMKNLKEYIIFFSILLVIFIIIHKSNLNWEKELVEKKRLEAKRKSSLDTIQEENENEEKEKNE
jgi:hypothetical protein